MMIVLVLLIRGARESHLFGMLLLQDAIDFVWTAGKSSKPKTKLVQEEVYNDYPYQY